MHTYLFAEITNLCVGVWDIHFGNGPLPLSESGHVAEKLKYLHHLGGNFSCFGDTLLQA